MSVLGRFGEISYPLPESATDIKFRKVAFEFEKMK